MTRLRKFIEANPARIAAFISSLVALAVTALAPDLPVDEAVIFVLAALGLGEYAQRKEDAKTSVALATIPPEMPESAS